MPELAKVEEKLDEYQLLKRIKNARRWTSKVGDLRYPINQASATPDQISGWENLNKYLLELGYLLESVLQLKLRQKFENLPGKERDEMLNAWSSQPEMADEWQLHAYYSRDADPDKLTKEIEQIRVNIGQNAIEIREDLAAWGIGPTHALWPKLTTDVNGSSKRVVSVDSSAKSGIGSDELTNSGPSTKTSRKGGDGSRYQQLIEANIIIVLTKKTRVTYKDVAIRITEKDISSLPPSFQDQMRLTNFAGPLLKFFIQEESNDKSNTFRKRFLRSFSQVKRAREERMAAQNRR